MLCALYVSKNHAATACEYEIRFDIVSIPLFQWRERDIFYSLSMSTSVFNGDELVWKNLAEKYTYAGHEEQYFRRMVSEYKIGKKGMTYGRTLKVKGKE